MKVILKNGDELAVNEGATCAMAAAAISEGLARNAVAAKVNGVLVDLSHALGARRRRQTRNRHAQGQGGA